MGVIGATLAVCPEPLLPTTTSMLAGLDVIRSPPRPSSLTTSTSWSASDGGALARQTYGHFDQFRARERIRAAFAQTSGQPAPMRQVQAA